MKVKIKKLNPNAKMPTQGTDGAVSVEPPRHTLDTTSTELARKRCQSTGSEVL